LKSENKDEKEDNYSIKFDLDMNRKEPTTSSQAEPINFNSPPQTQQEVG
jgi:hypothetical protein